MTTVGAPDPIEARRWAVWLVAALAVMNVARSAVVPHRTHFALNVAFALGVTALVAWRVRLGRVELGLGRGTLARGLRLGLAAFLAVAFVALVLAIIPAGRDALDVPDAHVSAGTLLWRVGLIIPIGTVLTEELLFRGLLHGLLSRAMEPTPTLIIGSLLFGMWHVFPAWRADGALAAAGTFVVTSVAGAIFLWLRARSDSVVAPMLAHLATNTVPLSAAWIVAR